MRGISNTFKRGPTKTVATRCCVAVLYFEVYVTWKCVLKGMPVSEPQQYPLYICFSAGTEINTMNKKLPIEKIVPGDLVCSVDPISGKPILCRVKSLRKRWYQGTFARVRIGGEVFTCTSTHPFLVTFDSERKGNYKTPRTLLEGSLTVQNDCGIWVEAGDLRPGSKLISRNGMEIPIEGLELYEGEGEV